MSGTRPSHQPPRQAPPWNFQPPLAVAAGSSPLPSRRLIQRRGLREQFSEQPLALCQPRVGEHNRLRLAHRVTNHALAMQPIESIPIVALPRPTPRLPAARAGRTVTSNNPARPANHLTLTLNNRLEQDHRGVKGRCRPVLGFKSVRSARRYCHGHDELRNFLGSQSRMCQHVPAATRRFHYIRRTTIAIGIPEAA
jgi:DDE domain